MPNIYNKLQPNYVNSALPNAEWLRKQKGYHDMHGSYKLKPIATVDMLSESLLSLDK